MRATSVWQCSCNAFSDSAISQVNASRNRFCSVAAFSVALNAARREPILALRAAVAVAAPDSVERRLVPARPRPNPTPSSTRAFRSSQLGCPQQSAYDCLVLRLEGCRPGRCCRGFPPTTSNGGCALCSFRQLHALVRQPEENTHILSGRVLPQTHNTGYTDLDTGSAVDTNPYAYCASAKRKCGSVRPTRKNESWLLCPDGATI